MPVRLVVFDLDGTLVDSRRDLADSANEMLGGYGAPPLTEAAIVRMVGGGAATLVTRALAAAHVDTPIENALARFLTIYDRRLTKHTRPYDGVAGALRELREERITTALLTNKPLEQAVAILRAFDLFKYFPWRVGGDGPWPRKPDPEGLRFLMDMAQAQPRDTMLVGDSSTDWQTARNADVRVCLARYGFGFPDLAEGTLTGEEWLVDHPREIPEVARQAGA